MVGHHARSSSRSLVVAAAVAIAIEMACCRAEAEVEVVVSRSFREPASRLVGLAGSTSREVVVNRSVVAVRAAWYCSKRRSLNSTERRRVLPRVVEEVGDATRAGPTLR